MQHINQIALSGNLTQDPILRETKNGSSVLNISLASSDTRKTENTYQEFPLYIDCVLFGNLAPQIADKLHKGDAVTVAGKLRYSTYEDKSGNKRSKHEILIDTISY